MSAKSLTANQCNHITPAADRCRMLVASDEGSFCIHHLAKSAVSQPGENPSAELLNSTGDLASSVRSTPSSGNVPNCLPARRSTARTPCFRLPFPVASRHSHGMGSAEGTTATPEERARKTGSTNASRNMSVIAAESFLDMGRRVGFETHRRLISGAIARFHVGSRVVTAPVVVHPAVQLADPSGGALLDEVGKLRSVLIRWQHAFRDRESIRISLSLA